MLYPSFPISKVGMDGQHPAGTARSHSASRLEQAVLAGLKLFVRFCRFEVADVSVFGTVWRTSNVFRSVRFAQGSAGEAFNRVFAPSWSPVPQRKGKLCQRLQFEFLLSVTPPPAL